jgi:hypothetical protein
MGAITFTHLQGATQQAAETLYVSTKFLDSLFDHTFSSAKKSYAERFTLKVILAGGYGLRAVLYGAMSLVKPTKKGKEQFTAMRHYAKYVLNFPLRGRS